MKLALPVLALALAAGIPLAGCAQQGNAAENGSSADARTQMQAVRDGTRVAAFNDLSAGDRAKVQAIVDQVNGGQLTDLRAAAQQVDAVLTPAESKAVLGERDKMMQAIRANMPSPSDAGSPGNPRGSAVMGRSVDAGRFLLQLGVSREKMRELRTQQQPKQQSQ